MPERSLCEEYREKVVFLCAVGLKVPEKAKEAIYFEDFF